jgi:hypothetical protein
MTVLPAIIVVAYNRPATLKRLLQSIAASHFAEVQIPMVISIDEGDNAEVVQAAENFKWPHGTLRIIKRDKHLGLKEHILQCGDLTDEYGAVIMLEDDLYVSPYFYDYTCQALNFYVGDDQQLAGISLYNYEIDETIFAPFEPYDDGADIYFMQVASSWGQCWASAQWQGFRQWLAGNEKVSEHEYLPDYIARWGEHSWKKHFIRYLMATDRYFVFPRDSLSTNFGEPGTNTDRRGLFQVELLTRPKAFKFCKINESKSIYDTSFELKAEVLKKLNPFFENYDFEVDLHNTKDLNQITSPWLLSSKNCANPVQSFSNDLKPLILNMVNNEPGHIFHFGKTVDFSNNETDNEIFYPGIAVIAERIFRKRINDFANERSKEQIYLHQRYNDFREFGVILLHDKNDDSYRGTLQSILEQDYLHVNLYFLNLAGLKIMKHSFQKFINPIIINPDMLPYKFNAFATLPEQTASQYFIILRDGETIAKNAFHSVNEIFKKYGDVHFLQGLSAAEVSKDILAEKRINRNIFVHRLIENNLNIGGSQTYFTRHAISNILDKLKDSHEDFNEPSLWYQLLEGERLYITDAVLSDNEPITARNIKGIGRNEVNWSFADALAEFFFLKDISFLRYFFPQRQQLPPVIRFNKETASFYMSPY